MTDKPRFLLSTYVEALDRRGRLIFGDYGPYRRRCSLEDAVFTLRDCDRRRDGESFSMPDTEPDRDGVVVAEHVLVEGIDRRPLPDRQMRRLARLAGIPG